MATRLEHDLLGEIPVPADALYGAQTQRAVLNFPLNGQRALADFPTLVRGLLLVKQAAALANGRAGHLEARVADAIGAACRDLLDRPRPDAFPIHHLHGGGGTSANMNANEVLANLAEERLGGRRGQYRLVHPNDHVNLHQSTNDVYPAACHLAVILEWPRLKSAAEALDRCLAARLEDGSRQARLARTCLQDAVRITFGDLFGGYRSFLARRSKAIAAAVDTLHALPLGGTIVGRRVDVPDGYWEAIYPALREVTADPAYARNDNLFDAAQNLDDLVRVSAELDLLSRGLVKISQDLRLLNSGPEAGLGEIRLPAVQPGSSIMPGKINPVIPEHAIQLAFRAMGLHVTCQACLDHGELDLNVWESAAVFAVLEAMDLLAAALAALDQHAFQGLAWDGPTNNRHADATIPLLTELMKRHGYSRVTAVCKKAGGDWARLREELRKAFPDAPAP